MFRRLSETTAWRLYHGIVLWTLAVTLLRTVREPNVFSTAHYFVTYDMGFIKRGLVGSVLDAFASLLGTPLTVTTVAILASFCLAGLVGLFVLLLWRMPRWFSSFEEGALLGLVAASSPFVVMSAHTNGYFDNLLFLMAAGGMWLVWHERWFAVAVLGVAGVLIHETFLVIGPPLWVATLVWHEPGRFWRHLPWVVLPPVAAMIGVVAGGVFAWEPGALRAAYTARFKAAYPPAIAKGMPDMLAASFRDYWRAQSGHGWERLFNEERLPLVFPSLAALMWMLVRRIPQPADWRRTALLAAAIVAPCTLHFIAWDTMRFQTYPLMLAWLLLALTATTSQPKIAKPLRFWGILLIGVLVWNSQLRLILMDHLQERFAWDLRCLLYAPAYLLAAALLLPLWPVARNEAAVCTETKNP